MEFLLDFYEKRLVIIDNNGERIMDYKKIPEEPMRPQSERKDIKVTMTKMAKESKPQKDYFEHSTSSEEE